MSEIFTPIMVIGTILALIFAAGALWTSLSRHRAASSAKAASDEDRIVFKPMPSVAPEINADAAPDENATDKSASNAPPLFRQVRPPGNGAPANDRLGVEDVYAWE